MWSTEHSNLATQSDARDSGSSWEAPIARGSFYRAGITTAAGIGALVLLSAAFYRVRELLAALILFGFLFGVVILAILIFWLVGETAHQAATVLETQMPHVLPHTISPARAHSHPVRRNQQWN